MAGALIGGLAPASALANTGSTATATSSTGTKPYVIEGDTTGLHVEERIIDGREVLVIYRSGGNQEPVTVRANTGTDGQVRPRGDTPDPDEPTSAADDEPAEAVTVDTSSGPQVVVLGPPPGPDATHEEKLNWFQRAWRALFGDDKPEGTTPEELAPTPTATPTPGTSRPSEERLCITIHPAPPGCGDDDETTDGEPTPTPTSTATPTTGTDCPEDARASIPTAPPYTTGQGISEDGRGPEGEPTPDASSTPTPSAGSGRTVEDGQNSSGWFSDEVRKEAVREAAERAKGASGDCDDKTPAPTQPGTQSWLKDMRPGQWLSGISGSKDRLGAARGKEAVLANTWAHGGENSITLAALRPGGEYGPDKWSTTTDGQPRSLIVSVEPFPTGGSWEKAAAGDYDERWSQMFSTGEELWGDRPGTLIWSPAWELNGNWYDWSVKAGQERAVRDALDRMYEVKRKTFPDSMLILTFNKESVGFDGDSSELVPEKVDGIGVDYYNAFPVQRSKADFEKLLTERDGGGGPKGLETWRQTAEQHGVPLFVPEWSGSAKDGDHPDFIRGMHSFFTKHAGPGAGQVAGEALFEIAKDGTNWELSPNVTKMPKAAATYRELFGGGARQATTSSPDPTTREETETDHARTAPTGG
ncbi:hypothetical protein [Kineococcus sp. NUM-3379]